MYRLGAEVRWNPFGKQIFTSRLWNICLSWLVFGFINGSEIIGLMPATRAANPEGDNKRRMKKTRVAEVLLVMGILKMGDILLKFSWWKWVHVAEFLYREWLKEGNTKVWVIKRLVRRWKCRWKRPSLQSNRTKKTSYI